MFYKLSDKYYRMTLKNLISVVSLFKPVCYSLKDTLLSVDTLLFQLVDTGVQVHCYQVLHFYIHFLEYLTTVFKENDRTFTALCLYKIVVKYIVSYFLTLHITSSIKWQSYLVENKYNLYNSYILIIYHYNTCIT